MSPQQHFVKRVIGVPGDRIRMKNKQVFVNGTPLPEKYVVYRSTGHDAYRDDFPRPELLNSQVEPLWWTQMRTLVRNGELTVPPGHYFALGDNRDESLDSRYWGFVPSENIIGRPLVIYWSVSNPGRVGQLAENSDDRLVYFAYTVTHWVRDLRWRRTLQRIR
jgi:signal peptidase I